MLAAGAASWRRERVGAQVVKGESFASRQVRIVYRIFWVLAPYAHIPDRKNLRMGLQFSEDLSIVRAICLETTSEPRERWPLRGDDTL